VTSVVCLTRHIIAGHGCRKVEYRAGDLVLASLVEAFEWCLRGWAKPAEIHGERPRENWALPAYDLPQWQPPAADDAELELAAVAG
jgi:hypothetical protein